MLKMAVTDRVAFRVTWHVVVPEQEPPHPANVEPAMGVAVSWTTVPLLKVAPQAVPQLMPAGLLVTVPAPVPEALTVSWKVGGVVPPPELPPPHPVKVSAKARTTAAATQCLVPKFIGVLQN